MRLVIVIVSVLLTVVVMSAIARASFVSPQLIQKVMVK